MSLKEEDRRTLANLEIERAEKTYTEQEGLIEKGYWNTLANRFRRYIHLFLLNIFPKLIISRKWKRKFGYSIDWKHPRDINEKIQWLLVYSDTSEWTRLADKYKVREYVKEKGLANLLVPLYGVWETTEEIDFDGLPDKFVIKCNHDFGSTIIVDKNDINYNQKLICKKLNKCLKRDFGYNGELHYRGIPRKIIAEKYLELTELDKRYSTSLIDYKVWCLEGEPCSILVCYNRGEGRLYLNVYDLDWIFHPEYSLSTRHCEVGDGKIPSPMTLPEMLSAASVLSKGFHEVRVDFYEVEGRLYFGEMTFTCNEGMIDYYTPEFLKMLGDRVKLPIQR